VGIHWCQSPVIPRRNDPAVLVARRRRETGILESRRCGRVCCLGAGFGVFMGACSIGEAWGNLAGMGYLEPAGNYLFCWGRYSDLSRLLASELLSSLSISHHKKRRGGLLGMPGNYIFVTSTKVVI